MADDLTLTCEDCGAAFRFTAGEQAFFASRGLREPPRRCPTCRTARKRRAIASFGQARPTPAPHVGPFPTAGTHAAPPHPPPQAPQQFDVACDACGGPARVSFRPPIGRLVYCHECYTARQVQVSGLRPPRSEG